jgi:hypothetical protein
MLTRVKGRGGGPDHRPDDLFIAFWAGVALFTVMLLTIVLIIVSVTNANDGFTAIVTFFSPQLKK